jgi:hypothetical protein
MACDEEAAVNLRWFRHRPPPTYRDKWRQKCKAGTPAAHHLNGGEKMVTLPRSRPSPVWAVRPIGGLSRAYAGSVVAVAGAKPAR